MRHLLPWAVLTGSVLAATPAARADLSWFNSPSNLVYYADGTTPLYGVKDDSAISCFVQLIYAGDNTAIDPAIDSGDGTTGDDVVAAFAFIGANLPGTVGSPTHYGRVNGGTYVDDLLGGAYYVRVWSAPSPDFGAGLIPSAPTNFYGNSSLFTAEAGHEAPTPPLDVNFGGPSGFATTIAVPEPSVGVLALGGTLAWLAMRRRRLA